MKKIVVLLLSCLMLAGMGMSVFANENVAPETEIDTEMTYDSSSEDVQPLMKTAAVEESEPLYRLVEKTETIYAEDLTYNSGISGYTATFTIDIVTVGGISYTAYAPIGMASYCVNEAHGCGDIDIDYSAGDINDLNVTPDTPSEGTFSCTNGSRLVLDCYPASEWTSEDDFTAAMTTDSESITPYMEVTYTTYEIDEEAMAAVDELDEVKAQAMDDIMKLQGTINELRAQIGENGSEAPEQVELPAEEDDAGLTTGQIWLIAALCFVGVAVMTAGIMYGMKRGR